MQRTGWTRTRLWLFPNEPRVAASGQSRWAHPSTRLCPLLIGVLIATGGCSSAPRGEGVSTQSVRPGDFVATAGDRPVSRPATEVDESAPSHARLVNTNPDAAAGNQTTTLGGGPVPKASHAAGPVLLDAKVGDINGKPIYANQFLEPIADRLDAEADRMPRAQWIMLTDRVIKQRLDGMITDELLQAEAMAVLSPEQRQGLRGFLQNVRTNLASQSLGSERLAEKRLLEQEGKTLEDVIQKEEQLTLVRLSIMREINRRVNVSWRDIQQQYERDSDIYNPPPEASFRLILVPTKAEDEVAQINARLASSEPFAEIAASELNRFKPEDGGEQTGPIDGVFNETEFFGPEELNEAAWSLTPGQWAGPVTFKSQTGWLLYEGLSHDSIPLYDAQLEILKELTTQRREEELNRYINRLVERARVSDRADIHERLLAIAAERYAPAE